MSIKGQLFIEQAICGIDQCLLEMVKIHTAKKGKRFNVEGITYEIGTPSLEETGIKFEISSKIPEESFIGKADLDSYFKKIKGVFQGEKEKPSSVKMENIIHGTVNKNAEKSRDYVKISYNYKLESLFDEKKIAKEIVSVSSDKAALKKVPHVPGVMTLGGRLVLKAVKDSMYSKCFKNVESLIAANKKVKKELEIK